MYVAASITCYMECKHFCLSNTFCVSRCYGLDRNIAKKLCFTIMWCWELSKGRCLPWLHCSSQPQPHIPSVYSLWFYRRFMQLVLSFSIQIFELFMKFHKNHVCEVMFLAAKCSTCHYTPVFTTIWTNGITYVRVILLHVLKISPSKQMQHV